MITGYWGTLSIIVAAALAVVICIFALMIAYRVLTNGIDLSYLIAEPADPDAQRELREWNSAARRNKEEEAPPETPKASLARFQFLIFTFVIAGVYLVLCLESGHFVDIPQNAILLLGVSGTSYAASKGIQAASVTSQKHADAQVRVAQAQAGVSPPPPPPRQGDPSVQAAQATNPAADPEAA